MRVLMILIPDNGPKLAGKLTLRLELIAGAYYVFLDAGFDVVLASPEGGFPWMGTLRPERENSDITVRRFKGDRKATDDLRDTIAISQAYADDFDAALCIGSPGPIWRKGGQNLAGTLIANFLVTAKPVAITPSDLDLAPHGAGAGLLITGDSAGTPSLAAHAIIGALRMNFFSN